MWKYKWLWFKGFHQFFLRLIYSTTKHWWHFLVIPERHINQFLQLELKSNIMNMCRVIQIMQISHRTFKNHCQFVYANQLFGKYLHMLMEDAKCSIIFKGRCEKWLTGFSESCMLTVVFFTIEFKWVARVESDQWFCGIVHHCTWLPFTTNKILLAGQLFLAWMTWTNLYNYQYRSLKYTYRYLTVGIPYIRNVFNNLPNFQL